MAARLTEFWGQSGEPDEEKIIGWMRQGICFYDLPNGRLWGVDVGRSLYTNEIVDRRLWGLDITVPILNAHMRDPNVTSVTSKLAARYDAFDYWQDFEYPGFELADEWEWEDEDLWTNIGDDDDSDDGWVFDDRTWAERQRRRELECHGPDRLSYHEKEESVAESMLASPDGWFAIGPCDLGELPEG